MSVKINNTGFGVCMVTGAFFPEISGGGLQCKTLIEALDRKITPFVITTTTFKDSPLRDSVNAIKVFRIYLNPNSLFSKIKAFFILILIFFKIQPKIKIFQLHGFSLKNIPMIILVKLSGKKAIQKLTSLGVDDPISISRQKWGRIKLFWLSYVDAFISVSPGLMDKFMNSSLKNKKLFFIPNGVDTDRFIPLDILNKKSMKKQLGLDAGKKIVLFIGFFSYDKCPDLLLKSWLMCRPRFKNQVQLLFIGASRSKYFEISADLVQRIKKEAEELEKEGEVKFIEKTLNIQAYYQAADIFVLPSRREGLPNALMEAMSCGLACIATRLGGITDYLIDDGKDGLLFAPQDAQELSNKLNMLLNNQEYAQELGINARKKVERLFSIKLISERYFDMYNQVL